MVSRVPEASTNDLDHRSNAGTAGDHCNMLNEIRRVKKVAFRAFDMDGLAGFEKRNVFRNIPLLIGLHK